MTILLAAAQRLHDLLPTLGGQRLNDVEHDLQTLRTAAMVLVRRGIDEAPPTEIAVLKGMIDDVETRRDDWTTEMKMLIDERYPDTDMDVMANTGETLSMMSIEMKLIETAGHVMLSIDGVESSLPGDNVTIDGETLVIDDTRDQRVLELPLADVAAFGFVDDDGEGEIGMQWTGFDVLTNDGRFITLR